MFCPVCKAEYRPGFTRCSDCDADLVERLDDDSGVPGFTGDPDAMEVLWAGISAEILASIERALDAVKIQFTSDSVDSQFMPAFRQDIFRVQVRRRDYAAAASALQGVDGGDSIAEKSPAAVLDKNSSFLEMFGINRNLMSRALEQAASSTGEEADEEPEPEPIGADETGDAGSSQPSAPDDLVEDFYPEDATSEAWSGGDAQMAQYIKICLAENGIACVLQDDGGKHRVLVLPAAEPRAKEITREIVEGTPPE